MRTYRLDLIDDSNDPYGSVCARWEKLTLEQLMEVIRTGNPSRGVHFEVYVENEKPT